MKPLLAHKYEPQRISYPCYVQPKLNGVRALYQNGRFQSRDELPFPVGLLDHLSQPLQQVFGPETILDGELYVHGWPLQRILGAITPIRNQPKEDTLKVEYHVFDVVDYTKSFRKRIFWPSVNLNYPRIGQVEFVQWDLPDSEEAANDCYARFVSAGYEGMMYRLGDCPYTISKQHVVDAKVCPGLTWMKDAPRNGWLSDQDNRTWHLLKRKDWQDDEFEIVDFELTRGELGEEGFRLYCKTPSGKSFKVSSGLTATERQQFADNPPCGRQAKIKYLVLSSDGIPLNATILCILP